MKFFSFARYLAASVVFLGVISCCFSQNQASVEEIFENYNEFKEPALAERRITRRNIEPLVEEMRSLPEFKVQKVGESIEGRELSLISIGSGDTSVFLWSQMHGDESTATMALFDIFNFLVADDFAVEKEKLLQNVTLHFLPMLNPDGAERFQRRNALGIDVNRDALRLQSPEGKTLKRVRDSLDADWGFNLHDQSKYYNAEGTAKPASISFLAPAFDFEKSIDEKREDAMQLIVGMNQKLQEHFPGQVARYNDDFEPRAFGDNIQKWGTRTILIESGGNYEDPEKQEIRKMNFLAILSALFAISEKTYENANREDYNDIPWNDRNLFDLKLSGLTYRLSGEKYILDLGINHSESFAPNSQRLYYRSRVADQGDLSTHYGYKSLDVSGYELRPGAVYPEVLADLAALEDLDLPKLIAEGYGYFPVKNLPESKGYSEYPVQVVGEDFEVPSEVYVGADPTFFLEKNGKLEYAVINGFLHEIGKPLSDIKNGVILR